MNKNKIFQIIGMAFVAFMGVALSVMFLYKLYEISLEAFYIGFIVIAILSLSYIVSKIRKY